MSNTPTPKDVAEQSGESGVAAASQSAAKSVSSSTGSQDFSPITSQEELNRIIQQRVARAKESAAEEERKKFEGYHAPDEFASLKSRFEETEKSLHAEQRKSAARTAGLPESMADRLVGSSPDEWAGDASSLAEQLLAGAGVAHEASKSEESQVKNVTPKHNPAGRGVGGGRPDAEEDFVLDEVLNKIPRY